MSEFPTSENSTYPATAVEKYEQAVNQWAFCIAEDNGLQGITMGRVFTLAEIVGRNWNKILADLREAQAKLVESNV